MKFYIKFVLLLFLANFLSSCIESKKDLVTILNVMEPEAKDLTINLAELKRNEYWGDSINYVNQVPSNIEVNNFDTNSNSYINSPSGSFVTAPIYVDKKVFALTSSGYLCCYDLEKKKYLWISETDFKVTEKANLYHNKNMIFINTGGRQILAFDLENGKKIWFTCFDNFVFSTPVVNSDQIFFVQTVGDKIYAIDYNNGKTLWSNEEGGSNMELSSRHKPLLFQDNLIVTTGRGNIISLQATNGKKNWSKPINPFYDLTNDILIDGIVRQASIEGNLGYFVSMNYVVCIDVSNGSFKWRKKIDNMQNFLSSGSALFVVTNDYEFIALDKNSGKVIWVSHLEVKKLKDLIDPIVANSYIYMASKSGFILQINPYNGETTSILNFGKKIVSQMAVDGFLYVTTPKKIFIRGL